MTTKQLLSRLAKLLVLGAVLIGIHALLVSDAALIRIAFAFAPDYVPPSAEQMAERENAITRMVEEEYPHLTDKDCSSQSSAYFRRNCEERKALARSAVSREPRFLHPKEVYDRKEIQPRVEIVSNAVEYGSIAIAVTLGLYFVGSLLSWFRATAYPALAPRARLQAKMLHSLISSGLVDRRMSAAASQLEALEKLFNHGAITDAVYKAKREEIRSRFPADLK